MCGGVVIFMPKIIDISGKEHEIECIACAIQVKEVELPVERIFETENFVVEQDFEWPIEGFLIIASKRHIHSVLEFNEDEESEFLEVFKKSRKAMKDVLEIDEVTIIQEEGGATSTSHFHVWLFPWHNWMRDHGSKLQDIRLLMKQAKERFSDEESLEKLKSDGMKLREYFLR